jgi:branched-subunit amino acid transport protein
MNSLETWVTIVGLTLVTIVTRAGFLLVPQRYGLPGWLNRGLRYAPACALVAIIVPDLGLTGLDAHGLLGNARLLGMLAGIGVFLMSRSMLATIGVGMLVFSVVR